MTNDFNNGGDRGSSDSTGKDEQLNPFRAKAKALIEAAVNGGGDTGQIEKELLEMSAENRHLFVAALKLERVEFNLTQMLGSHSELNTGFKKPFVEIDATRKTSEMDFIDIDIVVTRESSDGGPANVTRLDVFTPEGGKEFDDMQEARRVAAPYVWLAGLRRMVDRTVLPPALVVEADTDNADRLARRLYEQIADSALRDNALKYYWHRIHHPTEDEFPGYQSTDAFASSKACSDETRAAPLPPDLQREANQTLKEWQAYLERTRPRAITREE